MDGKKVEQLRKRGIVPTTVEDLLGLSPEELALINLKLHLVKLVKEMRKKGGLTQADLAKQIGSSQPRVAKIENGDPAVSLDLIFRALLTLRVPTQEIAFVIDDFQPSTYTGPSTYEVVIDSKTKRNEKKGDERIAKAVKALEAAITEDALIDA